LLPKRGALFPEQTHNIDSNKKKRKSKRRKEPGTKVRLSAVTRINRADLPLLPMVQVMSSLRRMIIKQK
jgi:hypothetical protein